MNEYLKYSKNSILTSIADDIAQKIEEKAILVFKLEK